MTKDLLLAAVFLLNIALMAYITLDVMRRKKDSSETNGDTPDTNDKSQSEPASTPVRKAGKPTVLPTGKQGTTSNAVTIYMYYP